MKKYPLFYLRPVFDTVMHQLQPLLEARFECLGFHSSDMPVLLPEQERPWVLLGDQSSVNAVFQHANGAHAACVLYLEAAESVDPLWIQKHQLVDYTQGLPDAQRLLFALNRTYSQFTQAQQLQQLSQQLSIQHERLRELNAIGASLSTERNLDRLLDKILASCMEITASDSGSLYLVESRQHEAEEQHFLRFKWARNQSLVVDFSEFTMEMNERSIAGAVAVQGKPLNIRDVYSIGTDVPYGFNKSFDQNTGYRSKSMLTVPMTNPKGEVIGVLQMINKKLHANQALELGNEAALEAEILSYSQDDEELLSSLASQGAVAIENARLYAAIQHLFEGFIRASVQAIESRDPTTSGHSERVAVLTTGLAQQVDRIDSGPFAPLRFSRDDLKEIKYASLLHDFGKIGVREHVLVKAEKLYTHELDAIQARFRLIAKSLESRYHADKLELLMRLGPEAVQPEFAALDQRYQHQLSVLQQDLGAILQANRPSILAQEVSEQLAQIQQKVFEIDGESIALLAPFELSRLSILKGSLDSDERKEIESHVTHTFHFLSQIPWTRELRNVPQIAYAHHEKLNGRGYPQGLAAADIPVQSRMMTIADIYDALTASDRPYKKALPVAKALDILGFEVKDGMLDAELYKIFVESRVYEAIGAES